MGGHQSAPMGMVDIRLRIAARVAHQEVEVFTPSAAATVLVVAYGLIVGLFWHHGQPHPYDKMIHAGLFSALMFFASTSARNLVLLPAVFVLAMAVMAEPLQYAVTGRAMSGGDVIANAFGCFVGLVVLLQRDRYFELCEKSPFFRSD